MKNESDLVTIITLSYKKYAYIYDAIKSVMSQDYTNIQYIISDDGATNFPKENIEGFIKRYKTEHIKEVIVLSNNKNVGTVKNLNRAMTYAKGKYIVHLSADDVFYNDNVISSIVSCFHIRKCSVLGTLRLRCDENLKPIRYMPAKFYQRRIMRWNTSRKQYEAFVTGNSFEMISGSVMCYTRHYWEKHHFDESYILWEDGPFIERFLREGNFLELNYNITAIYYREGGVSTSIKLNPLMEKDIETYHRKVYRNSLRIKGVKREIINYLKRNYMYNKKLKLDFFKLMRNIKSFNLLIKKLYYRYEMKIVYYIEEWLMRNNFIE